MATTVHDNGAYTRWTGIMPQDGGFLARTFDDDKTFKTERGAVRWLASEGYTAEGKRLPLPGERLVSEVEGKAPETGAYRFVVSKVLDTDGNGFQVEARGPRGLGIASVWGDVTRETVIGAAFYRN